MSRVVHNLVRLPRRMLGSILRQSNPIFRLQRQADRAVRQCLLPQRMEALEAIAGMSSARENRLLAHLVMESPPGGCIVEIGAYKGKSTAWLVEAAQQRPDRPLVVSIDPHAGGTWEAFQETVARFRLCQRGLEVQRACSHEIGSTWDKPITFLWIDGSHEYADVLNDIEDFVPHVLPGGWIVFDDAQPGGPCPGVARAIAERMMGRPGFRHAGTIKHFDLFQRLPV